MTIRSAKSGSGDLAQSESRCGAPDCARYAAGEDDAAAHGKIFSQNSLAFYMSPSYDTTSNLILALITHIPFYVFCNRVSWLCNSHNFFFVNFPQPL